MKDKSPMDQVLDILCTGRVTSVTMTLTIPMRGEAPPAKQLDPVLTPKPEMDIRKEYVRRGPYGPQGSQPNKQGIPHCAAEPPDDDNTLKGKPRKRRRNLTNSEVAECRWLKHERGWSVPTIADRMDIPEKTVYRLLAGRSYPGIEPARPSWYDDETYDDTKPEGVDGNGTG